MNIFGKASDWGFTWINNSPLQIKNVGGLRQSMVVFRFFEKLRVCFFKKIQDWIFKFERI